MLANLVLEIVSLRTVVIVAATIAALIAAAATVKAASKPVERTRADVVRELAEAQSTLAASSQDTSVRFKVAKLLYQSGDFRGAKETLGDLAAEGQAGTDVLLLAAEVEYLLGQYDTSEKLYRRVLARSEAKASDRIKANVGLSFVLYQTNRFDQARTLEFGRGVQLPIVELMKSFQQAPYRIEWNSEQVAVAPFNVTDPLPVLTVEFNGRSTHVLFDTGADMCIVDNEVATELGLKEISSAVGAFGGGKPARMGFSKLDSLAIGGITLRDVPVMIIPTQRFSKAFADGKFPIGGIIGTGLIRQFLATLDYEHDRLLLRERSSNVAPAVESQEQLTAVPFALAATHLMMARGSVNGREGLTFFVDSGLAMDAAWSAPVQTLQYLGITKPERKIDPNSVGGGGGAFATGSFPTDSLELGSLKQQNLLGEFGAMSADTYWQNGFIQDGLISHRFLRQYATWTIDFDRMTYTFGRGLDK